GVLFVPPQSCQGGLISCLYLGCSTFVPPLIKQNERLRFIAPLQFFFRLFLLLVLLYLHGLFYGQLLKKVLQNKKNDSGVKAAIFHYFYQIFAKLPDGDACGF